MKHAMSIGARLVGAGLFALSVSVASAQETCSDCETEITTTPELAECFLERYQNLASQAGPVIVDLNDCPASRGVVEPLSTGSSLPDVEFMLTRTQLDCLRSKLQAPDLVLDPSATISLDACG